MTAGANSGSQGESHSRATPRADLSRSGLILAAAVGPADSATLTVLDHLDAPRSVHREDAAAEADELQYYLDEGPCLTASHTGAVTVLEDLAVETRWPRWIPRARAVGIRAVLSIPLPNPAPVGSLNLYSFAPRSYEPTDIDRAERLASHVGTLLVAERYEQHLQRAAETRTTIGQAQGILIERYHLTAADAFDVLRRYSQHHNIKLNRLADQLVTTGHLPHLAAETLSAAELSRR